MVYLYAPQACYDTRWRHVYENTGKDALFVHDTSQVSSEKQCRQFPDGLSADWAFWQPASAGGGTTPIRDARYLRISAQLGAHCQGNGFYARIARSAAP